MEVFRIARQPYIDDLSGTGGKLYGGRWNHKGTSIIHTSESRALAVVEFLVHVPMPIVPTDICIATIEIPDSITPEEVTVDSLPSNWRDFPAPPELYTVWSTSIFPLPS